MMLRMEHEYDVWDIFRPESPAMPPRLKSKHRRHSAQCPQCGSFDTREGEDTHGRYWRCCACKLALSKPPTEPP